MLEAGLCISEPGGVLEREKFAEGGGLEPSEARCSGRGGPGGDLDTENGSVGPGEGTIVGGYIYLFSMRRI